MSQLSRRAGIVPRNSIEVKCIELITLAHRYLNNMLDLDTQLVIERKVDWGKDTNYAGFIRARENLIVINFRKMRGHPLLTALIVLGHEMRHAVQYQQGWLDVKSQSRYVQMRCGERIESDTWKGELYKGVRYASTPWEVDAYEQQGKFAQAVIDAGVITQEQCEIVLPGERLFTVLEEDTKREVTAANEGRNICWFVAYSETAQENSVRRGLAFSTMKEKLIASGAEWDGTNFIVKDVEMQKKAQLIHSAYKKESSRKVNRDGSCWLALDQLSKKFPSWSEAAFNYAFKHHQELMQSQYVAWKIRELDISDFVC